jgi:hypothetical protein
MKEGSSVLPFPGNDLSSLPDHLIPSVRIDTPELVEMRRRRAERKRRGFFYLGPIPEEWAVACQAAHPVGYLLACAIRARSTMRRGAVPVSQALGDRLGIARSVRKQALAALEAAGLILVERKPGHAPLVTVLPWPSKQVVEG